MLARTRRRSNARPAAVAVELAFVLPFLIFLVGAGVDFARIFHSSQILANSARNGARYASDQYHSRESPYTFEEATFRDAANLPTTLRSVDAPVYGTDSFGRDYVEVTVRYEFRTVARFIGIPSQVNLSRTVRMNIVPNNPDGS